MKLVDATEYAPKQSDPSPSPPEEIPVREQPEISEVVQDTIQAVESTQSVETVENPIPRNSAEETFYLPQHKISQVPLIPLDDVLGNMVYPAMAQRQGIEGIVYLELYIDEEGRIGRIEILKDPGYGFAEAAKDAFNGIRCVPAEANGRKVPVRYRYPVRFQLK